MNIEHIPTPVAVYSERAAMILDAYCRDHRHDAVGEQDADGRVILTVGRQSWAVPSMTSLFESILSLTATDKVDRNTVRTRAQDLRTFNLAGEVFAAKELSLLACIQLGKYSPKSLKKWFGAGAYEDMIGRPYSPLEAMRRKIVLEEIETLRKAKFEAEDMIEDKFNKKYKELQQKRWAAINESNGKFDKQLSVLGLKLNSKN